MKKDRTSKIAAMNAVDISVRKAICKFSTVGGDVGGVQSRISFNTFRRKIIEEIFTRVDSYAKIGSDFESLISQCIDEWIHNGVIRGLTFESIEEKGGDEAMIYFCDIDKLWDAEGFVFKDVPGFERWLL